MAKSNTPPKSFLMLLIIVTSLILGLVVPTCHAAAQSTDPQEVASAVYTLEDFRYLSDITFEGVRVNRTFNIFFPSNWAFQSDAIITVQFSHSPALYQGSSMAVAWNGERVGSTLLTEESAQNGTLEITLPLNSIQQGYNALVIEFYMGITDDFCVDYDNPAIWAVVHKTTSIEVAYKNTAPTTELNSVINSLIDSSLLSENKITLILPSDPEVAHLNALAVMTVKLQQLADYRNIALDILTSDQAIRSEPSGNLILFATTGQINGFASDLMPEINSIYDRYGQPGATQNAISPEDGIISLQISPFDQQYLALILTGSTPESVEKSARAAAFDMLYEQAVGSWLVVRDIPKTQLEVVDSDNIISMKSLGLDTITAYGTREQTIQFNLPLSYLWNVDSEAWLDLHFAHSGLLTRDTSTLSVKVNSIPIASLSLTAANAEEKFEQIRIPLRFLKIGSNTITLQANMHYTNEASVLRSYCINDSFPQAWLTVHSDTAIRLPEIAGQHRLNLSSFPYGFADPFSFNNFNFIVPGDIDPVTLSALADLSLILGKSMLGNPANIQVILVDDNELVFEAGNYYILLGATQDLLSDSLNDLLPLPFNLEEGVLEENDFVLPLDTGAGVKGYLQVFEGQQGEVYLLLTANASEGIANTVDYLTDPSNRAELDGTVAIITGPETAAAYEVQPAGTGQEQKARTIQMVAPLTLQGQSVWIIRASIGVLLISLAALLIGLLRKDHTNRVS